MRTFGTWCMSAALWIGACADGKDGATGAQGAEGPAGEAGERGPVGDDGPKGPTGGPGATGQTGANGQDGDDDPCLGKAPLKITGVAGFESGAIFPRRTTPFEILLSEPRDDVSYAFFGTATDFTGLARVPSQPLPTPTPNHFTLTQTEEGALRYVVIASDGCSMTSTTFELTAYYGKLNVMHFLPGIGPVVLVRTDTGETLERADELVLSVTATEIGTATYAFFELNSPELELDVVDTATGDTVLTTTVTTSPHRYDILMLFQDEDGEPTSGLATVTYDPTWDEEFSEHVALANFSAESLQVEMAVDGQIVDMGDVAFGEVTPSIEKPIYGEPLYRIEYIEVKITDESGASHAVRLPLETPSPAKGKVVALEHGFHITLFTLRLPDGSLVAAAHLAGTFSGGNAIGMFPDLAGVVFPEVVPLVSAKDAGLTLVQLHPEAGPLSLASAATSGPLGASTGAMPTALDERALVFAPFVAVPAGTPDLTVRTGLAGDGAVAASVEDVALTAGTRVLVVADPDPSGGTRATVLRPDVSPISGLRTASLQMVSLLDDAGPVSVWLDARLTQKVLSVATPGALSGRVGFRLPETTTSLFVDLGDDGRSDFEVVIPTEIAASGEHLVLLAYHDESGVVHFAAHDIYGVTPATADYTSIYELTAKADPPNLILSAHPEIVLMNDGTSVTTTLTATNTDCGVETVEVGYTLDTGWAVYINFELQAPDGGSFVALGTPSAWAAEGLLRPSNAFAGKNADGTWTLKLWKPTWVPEYARLDNWTLRIRCAD